MTKLMDYITFQPLIDGTGRAACKIAAEVELAALAAKGAAAFHEGDHAFLRFLEENKGCIEARLGDDAGCFAMLVFAAVFPGLQELYERRGIPASVLADTLEEFNEKAEEFYGKNKCGGIYHDWLLGHMRGRLFQIGRLQYIVDTAFGYESDALPAVADVLDIHITARGRLDPVACQKSMDDAVSFAARHFPEREYKAFTLNSWLLDEQLEEFLPPESNIVQFARRFTRLPGEYDPGWKVYHWIFGFDKEQADYKSHTPRTALQRGAHTLLDEGRWLKSRAGFILI